MAEESRVLVGPIDSGALVKVIGRGTMEFCSQLFDYLSGKIDSESEKMGNIYFELSETNYLDSSFIGVIVSVEKKVRKASGATAIILNPTAKVKEILATMGLIDLLPFQENKELRNIEKTEEIQKKLEKDSKDIELLLHSHQSLMELNTENEKRFGLVEKLLKKELEKKEQSENESNS